MNASQPMKYQRITKLIVSSRGTESTIPSWFKDFSTFCASLETKLMIFPDIVASRP